MMYRTRTNSTHDERGVSLLMAVLVLASITAISFSLATIVFIEIRASADFVRSERALYASYAITEEALFKYSRGATFNYLNGEETLNGVALEATESSTTTSPYSDALSAGASEQYTLVNPEDPNGPGGYGGIQITNVSQNGATIQVQLYSIDPAEEGGARTLVTEAGPLAFNESFPDNGTEDLDPLLQYEVVVTNVSATNGVSFNIYTYDSNGIDKGLPNIGESLVEITASYLGLTRKYQAHIPVFDISSAPTISYRYLRIRTPGSNSWASWREIESYNTTGVKVTPSSASATASYGPANLPGNVYDGNITTDWNAGTTIATITIDYGSVKDFTRIRMFTNNEPSPATVTHYVETSTDGVTFTPLTSFGNSITTSTWLQYP
jgi:hypothetical protein